MFALYHPSENQYVGVEITHDELRGSSHILTHHSDLDDDAPYLFAPKTRAEAESVLEIARTFYEGEIPIGHSVLDYDCEITNLREYEVVEIVPYLSKS